MMAISRSLPWTKSTRCRPCAASAIGGSNGVTSTAPRGRSMQARRILGRAPIRRSTRSSFGEGGSVLWISPRTRTRQVEQRPRPPHTEACGMPAMRLASSTLGRVSPRQAPVGIADLYQAMAAPQTRGNAPTARRTDDAGKTSVEHRDLEGAPRPAKAGVIRARPRASIPDPAARAVNLPAGFDHARAATAPGSAPRSTSAAGSKAEHTRAWTRSQLMQPDHRMRPKRPPGPASAR